MVFPVVGGNESKGYEISNSLRFNSGDSARLTEDFSSASRQTFTFSTWFKRSKLSTTMSLLSSGTSNSERTSLFINSDDTVRFFSSESAAVAKLIKSNAVLRDPSAWYHLVLRYDSTQSTNTDRIRFYLNGSEMTYQSSPTYPAQNNSSIYIGSDDTHGVGCLFYGSTATEFFDGYMAETHYIDGTSYDHTQFGEFDNNGVWIPKKYTGGYGTNGFYLEFKQTGTSANSSGIGADTSGNDNHFTPTNLAATDVTEDTCTNNFAVCNVLSGKNTSDLTTGNLVLDADSTGDIVAPSTIGFSSGKWYMEMKSTITAGHGNRKTVGVYETDSDLNHPRQFTSSSPYNGVVVDLRNGSAYESADDGDATDISSFANNDICGLAYDADNGLLYVYKNGTAENSGNAINAGNALDTSKTYAFYIGQDGGGTNNGELFCNFGNPSFAISSGNNDGKYGNFEYAPPSGYYALCTKRLAEFG